MKKLLIILIYLISLQVFSNTYYIATPANGGNDANPGTFASPWASLNQAFTSTSVNAGDTVFIRGGVYYVITNGTGVRATRSGTSSDWIVYSNYQNEKPIFDFGNMVVSDIEYPGLRHDGVVFSGVDYVKFKGITVRNVKQYADRNYSRAIYLRDGIVTIENCIAYNNWGHGMHSNHTTGEGGIHTFINCDSYNNCDSISGTPAGSNAGATGNGYAAWSDVTQGETYFYNCRAWGVSDQGWSIGTDAYVRLEGCWSLANKAYVSGGGAGYKMGWQRIESTELRREVVNCVAAFNDGYGFFTNENVGGSSGATRSNHYNNIAYHNGFGYPSVGFGFLIQNTGESIAIQERRNFSNNVSYGNYVNVYNLGGSLYYSGSNNSWDTGVTVSNADFISVDSAGITAARQVDGSLPDNNFYNYFLKLASSSDLIDAGIDVGLDYNYEAPDLGPFEYTAPSYYVSTTGNNVTGDGSFANPWATWEYGVLQLNTGDTLFIRAGTYMATVAVSISANPNEGTMNSPIVVMGYPGDATIPILDGSNLNNTSLVRIENKYYWKLKDLEIRESHDTDGVYTNFCGINCYASNQIYFDNVIVHDIDGQGFRFQDCDTIYVRDCDSYNNYDPYNNGGKADGFQINSTPPTVSMVYFDNCRAWNNSDDGWDFLDNTRGVVDSCWAWANGYDTDGSGQGFKAGLQTGPPPSEAYIFTNNIAVYNAHGGMRANCNGQEWFIDSRWYNNTVAFNLQYGFNTSNLPGANMYTNVWRNNISYQNVSGDSWEDASTFIRDHNSWDAVPAITLSSADFISIDTTGISSPRQRDGSLPNNNCYNNFMKIANGSDLIDAGINVGIPYKSTAPDIGAFEYLGKGFISRNNILIVHNGYLVSRNMTATGTDEPEIDQIIADHTIVDRYDDIPQYYIDEVKKMWVSYAGESHAAGVRVGMNLLETLDPTYAVYTQESGTPAAYTTANLRFNTATWGDFSNSTGWRHSYGEEDWWTNSTALARTKAGLDYCYTTGPSLSAFGFGWCYDDSHTGSVSATADPVYGCRWYGRSLQSPSGSRNWGLDDADNAITGNTVNLDTYLAATQEYIDHCIANGYNTKVFFSTGPVEPTYYSGEAGYQASLKHQRIRDYVLADPTRILFDYADILCYDDGSEVMNTSTWSGRTFPFITTTNYGDGDIGHISEEGVIRIAKAMWWMLARMAGWDGN